MHTTAATTPQCLNASVLVLALALALATHSRYPNGELGSGLRGRKAEGGEASAEAVSDAVFALALASEESRP